MPVFSVFENGRKPRRTMRKFFDLNWLIHDKAVRPQPAARANGDVLKLTISDIAYIGFHVHGQRRAFPGVNLQLGHVNQSFFGRQIIWKRARQVVGMPLAPEAVNHQVHVLRLRIPIETLSQQFIELSKRFLKFRRIVARLIKIVTGMVLPRFSANVDDGYLVMKEIGEGELLRFDVWAGELDPESYAKVVALGCIEGRLPHWGERELAGAGLNVPPIATDVQHIHEGK